METILGWILVLVIVAIVGFFGYVIYRVVVNERDRKKYIPKPGDNVHFHNIGNNAINCEIDSIEGDTAIVKIKVKKNHLYPSKINKQK